MGIQGRLLFFLLLMVGLQEASVAFAAPFSGEAPHRQGDYPAAIESLRQARRISPLDPVLQRRLASSCLVYGLELLRREKFAEALAIFREGYDLEPENGQFSFYIGHILLRQGMPGEAEAYLLEALSHSGPLPDTWLLLGRLCYGQGRLNEAKRYVEQALENQPDEDSRKFLAQIDRELTIQEGMDTRNGGSFELSYVEGGEQLGSETLEVLHAAYTELGTLFNAFPAQPLAVILYGNQDFAAVTGAPQWAGGAYDGKIRVPVGGLRQMTPELRRILYHEYAHALLFSLTRGRAPRWLDEGLAQVAEGDWGAGHRLHLQQSGRDAGLIDLSRLERSFAGLSPKEVAAAYLQTHAFARYLLDRYGWPRVLDLLQALGSGESFAVALNSLLYAGEDFARIRQQWQEELVFSPPLQ